MQTSIEKYLEITNLYNDAVKDLKKTITKKDIVDGISKSLFDKYPEIMRLRFNAYAPYYSDGDPCVYSVGDLEYSTKELVDELRAAAVEEGRCEEDLEEDALLEAADEWYCSWGGENKELKQDIKTASKSLKLIENLIEDLLGDSIQVTMYRDKEFEIDEYSHD